MSSTSNPNSPRHILASAEFVHQLHRLERPSADNSQPFSAEFLGRSPGSETLAAWFAALGQLNRSAAGTSRFYQQAAMAIIDPGGLDIGHVLVREEDQWHSAACVAHGDRHVFQPKVLERLTHERVALFHPSVDERVSAYGESVVCAPVFNIENEISAAVYAVRSHLGTNKRRGIRPLEALWVQLLAESLTSANARLEREAEAARTQVLLEQAFPREVVGELLTNSAALDGTTREITILFADLRQSSSISESVNPTELCDLLRDVLTEMTEAVMSRGGVVVDYHGDGMAAMWNAPHDQLDHATRACQAAIDIVQRIDALSVQWRHRVPAGLKLVVGVHTGEAIVGNTGTEHRIKYGPRGTVINTASRLESAAKVLELPILISAATQAAIRDSQFATSQFATRRAATVKLRGIPQPVELYELINTDRDESVATRIRALEEVLLLLETDQLEQADERLQQILATDDADAVPGDISMLCEQIETSAKRPRGERWALDLASY